MAKYLRLALILLCLSGVLGAHALAADPTPIKIRDLGQERDFLLSEREVYVIHRTGTDEGGLRRRIEAGIAGAKVTNDTPTRALVTLSGPLDVASGARRGDPVSVALPDVEVLPVLYAAGALPDENSRRCVTREILVPLPQNETIAHLAASVGAVASRSTIKSGYYILTFSTPYHVFDALKTLRARALDAQPLVEHTMAKYSLNLPHDEFFKYQWHLLNTGQGNGVPGIDVNVLGAWQITKGAGVTLAIVDDCLQTLHPDLTDACPPISSFLHHDFNDNDNDPRPGSSNDKHGTSCAGVAAARQNNGNPDPNTGGFLGVTGAAPETRLLGLRLIAAGFTDDESAQALYWHPGTTIVDVSSNSWGPPDGFFGLAGPDILTREALRVAATEGRNGLGQVTCFAAGNGLFYGDDSNYDGFANSRFVLAVAALGHRGTQAIYSEPGANILVTAPSQGDFSSIAITTTDVTGVNGYNPALHNPATSLNLPNTDYTNTFNGTSSACPLVAGCVSLILAANPQLGWRDVKEIVASTANAIDVQDPTYVADPFWVLNGAGFKFNHKYGGGLINVSAAVARALSWKDLGAEIAQSHSLNSGLSGVVPATIPDDAGAKGLQRTFSFAADPNLRVEQIEVVVDISHVHRSDLRITLISPSGTRSVLADLHPQPSGTLDTDVDFKDYTIDFSNDTNHPGNQGWTFTTTHHWGENSSGSNGGKWTLDIRDLNKNGAIGTLNAATLNLYGTSGPAGASASETRFVIENARYSPPESVGTQVIKVKRRGPTATEAFVDYATVEGTATADVDYTSVSGTLHFSPGNQFSDTPIAVQITPDTNPEPTESFFVVLKNPVNGSLGGTSLATVDIYDDDGNEVTVVATDPEAAETDEGLPINTGTFTISRQTALGTALTVKFDLSGTATYSTSSGTDYSIDTVPLGALEVTIPALQKSATVTVTPRNDAIMEGTETVILKISPDAAYTVGLADTASVNIRDNDLPQIQLIATDDFARENPVDTGSMRIMRTTATGQPLVSDQPLTVFLDYRGTQIPPTQPGNQYTVTANGIPVINSVDIPAGTDHVDLTITPLDDQIYQPTKTVVIDLQVNPNYNFSFGFLSSATVHIVEDDPVPESKAPVVTIAEPSAKSFNAPAVVHASGVASDNDFVKRVIYRLNGGVWKIATFNPAASGPWNADLTPDLVLGSNIVEVQAIDKSDNQSKIVAKQFSYIALKDLTVTVNGQGTVSNGFAGTTQRVVGTLYSITAKPGAGAVFNGWTGLVVSSNPTISFVMPNAAANLTAGFVPSPFVPEIAGDYSGLGKATPFQAETSGYLKFMVMPTGAFTGQLTLNGIPYPVKGAFTGAGDYDGTIQRKNDVPLAVHLHIDTNVAGTKQITGTIKFGSFSVAVVADRAAYDKAHPAPPALVKNYTLLLPPAVPIGDAQRDPRGFGIGTMSIDASGIVKWIGTLADGSKKVSQTQALSKNNTWPLFLNLYNKHGVMLGDVVMDTMPAASDLSATVNWFKPVSSKDKYFPNGFKIEGAALFGSIYTAPPDGTRALDGFVNGADNGKVTLEEGNIFMTTSHKITLAADNSVAITNPSADALALSINAKTGMLAGTFLHPATQKKATIGGVLFQKQQKAFGLFIGQLPQKEANPQTGRVTLEHVP